MSSKKKWGESFLKSGAPLEYLAFAKMESLGFETYQNVEYERKITDGKSKVFSIDIQADKQLKNGINLELLIECKYHDPSKLWMFIPFPYDYMRAGWCCDRHILNNGPIEFLRHPNKRNFINLGQRASWNIVVSKDGVRQENQIYEGISQLVYALFPLATFRLFHWNWMTLTYPLRGSILPILVTNEELFLLKSNINDLNIIREANKPEEIANTIPWLFCKVNQNFTTIDYNYSVLQKLLSYDKDIIIDFDKNIKIVRKIEKIELDCMETYINRPQWVIIVNINALDQMVHLIEDYISSLKLISKREMPKFKGKKIIEGKSN